MPLPEKMNDLQKWFILGRVLSDLRPVRDKLKKERAEECSKLLDDAIQKIGEVAFICKSEYDTEVEK